LVSADDIVDTNSETDALLRDVSVVSDSISDENHIAYTQEESESTVFIPDSVSLEFTGQAIDDIAEQDLESYGEMEKEGLGESSEISVSETGEIQAIRILAVNPGNGGSGEIIVLGGNRYGVSESSDNITLYRYNLINYTDTDFTIATVYGNVGTLFTITRDSRVLYN